MVIQDLHNRVQGWMSCALTMFAAGQGTGTKPPTAALASVLAVAVVVATVAILETSLPFSPLLPLSSWG